MRIVFVEDDDAEPPVVEVATIPQKRSGRLDMTAQHAPRLATCPRAVLPHPTRHPDLSLPPGGGADAQMRAHAEGASKLLGQKVVVENKPGAVGTLGPSALVSAKPDGYLLSQCTNAVFRQPFITKTACDPKADFTYLMRGPGA